MWVHRFVQWGAICEISGCAVVTYVVRHPVYALHLSVAVQPDTSALDANTPRAE